MDYSQAIPYAGCKEAVLKLFFEAEKTLQDVYSKIDERSFLNQGKVLKAFQEHQVGEAHLGATTGYGYDDLGREVIDRIFADVFYAEDALVRHNIISGTHAISLCLFGVLRPGDTLVALTGKPYDTLEEAIGIRGSSQGSLADFGVLYREVPLKSDGTVDFDTAKKVINQNTKAVIIQRSMGYSWRSSFSVEDIGKMIAFAKKINPDIICIVDNCYGEFVEEKEPTAVGADLIAGSLIKNPGGGIAPCGGYVAGKKEFVKLASFRLNSPGIGKECGATLGFNKSILHGFFMAPHTVAQALKVASLASAVLDKLGFQVNPQPKQERHCIIQSVKFNRSDILILFCQGIQKGSPIDSFVNPEPWDMPGYENQVIMAAGTFTQGASIELSCDAPIKPPYIAYLQGSLTYEYGVYGLLKAVDAIYDLIS